jgi:hypothetical protein
MTDSLLAFRAELRDAAVRRIGARRRRVRIVLAAAVVLVAAAGAAITVAATHWPLGEPAPPEVVADFEKYTPQLGFNPDARGARLVARSDGISLYVTPTRQGTYCTVVATPWRGGKTMGDGGSCVTRDTVAEPIAAGVRDIGSAGDDRRAEVAIVGRVNDREAQVVRFTDPVGETIEAAIGAQGFFVAGVEIDLCPAEDWQPMFSALDEAGGEVASASILLVKVHRRLRGCGFPVGPHRPYR